MALKQSNRRASIALKLKISAFLAVVSLFLGPSALPTQAMVLRSRLAPNIMADYMGKGYNSVSQNLIEDQTCLKFSQIETESVGRISNISFYCFVNSKQELADKFLYNFSANTSGIPEVTAKSRVTELVVNNTTVSSNKITLIAYWKQEHRRIFSNDLPAIDFVAQAMLKQNPKEFFQHYGDRYISGLTLGRVFYIVYQADISNYAGYPTRAKQNIKRAMEMSLKNILGTRLTVKEEAFVNEELKDVIVISNTYGSDDLDFVGPYSPEDFKNILKKVNSSQIEIIAKELKAYSRTHQWEGDALFDTLPYLKMAEEWRKHSNYLNYLMSNSKIGFKLIADCRKAANGITDQLKLIGSLNSEARFPTEEDVTAFYNLYRRYLDEIQIVPRTYYMPVQDRADLDLSALNDVASIRINCFITKRSGFFINLFHKQKPVVLRLYMVDTDGNWSELTSVMLTNKSTATLYEGTKFCDRFKIGLSDPKKIVYSIQTVVSFIEKVDDIIWLLVHGGIGG